MPRKTILIVDDHKLMLDGLSRLIEGYDHIEVKGVAQSGQEALEKIKSTHYDFVLLDISMPVMNGIETLKEIKKISRKIKVIMLTMHHDFTSVAGALHLGADGYLLKDSGIDEILNAFKITQSGGIYINKEIKDMLRVMNDMELDVKNTQNPYVLLSNRELQIAKLFADGLTSLEIAAEIFVSINTVETHRRNIFSKLKINKTSALVKYIYENGLI